MSSFAVIIPAAGDSSRFKGFRQKKPFVELKGRPIWLRTVDHFVNRPDVSEVVLVLARTDIEEFQERFEADLPPRNFRITEGGACRSESVMKGIRALRKPAEYIAVHDAARPLLTRTWVSEIFAAAIEKQAVIPGVSVSSTVKSVAADGRIESTIDRTPLRLAQTPQVFRRTLLENAYQQVADSSVFTDEASLVEAAGHPVFVHEGWPINIKITTKDDFNMAEALLAVLAKDSGIGVSHRTSSLR
ncbi:MAG: 2-C-methyl-D-erythritol 4-phosphate cytidylyltransferase [Fuerstiella sp.]